MDTCLRDVNDSILGLKAHIKIMKRLRLAKYDSMVKVRINLWMNSNQCHLKSWIHDCVYVCMHVREREREQMLISFDKPDSASLNLKYVWSLFFGNELH